MEKQELHNGLRLLKKGQKGLLRMIFGRMGIVLLLLIVQFLILFAIFFWFEDFLPHYYGAQTIFLIAMVLYLLNSGMDPSSKITWLVIIMIVPVFGSLLWLFTKSEFGHKAMKWRIRQINKETEQVILQPQTVIDALTAADPGAAALTRFAGKGGCSPVFTNTQVTYFPLGEDKFERMLRELEKAEKFIFLEYFIIDEGDMWGQILEILACKAKQGVEVRVLYDGTCELALLPKSYPKRLEALGIKCKVFAPAMPFLSTHYNYRDHRKIAVVDGRVAFNGGINLADEYINRIPRFGHWKDTAVMLQGDAVDSFTLMFLQMWNLSEKKGEYERYLRCQVPRISAPGFVMPFGDCPLDDVRTGQQVYMDILYRAKRYVHIMTPYLILDSEMENALKYAAARGVEIKLLLPGVPDKKPIYYLGKTHYKSLLSAGVQIYEYTPGFVHAKVFVCDDCEAVVGTINLDYRSLCHHFECATYMLGVDCIPQIEADFQNCLQKSRQVNMQTANKEKWYIKLTGYLLKVVAPLL